MAGKRYKHPDTLKDRRPQRVKAPIELLPTAREPGDIPPAPPGLLAASRDHWQAILSSTPGRMIHAEDGASLQRYIYNVDAWLRARSDLAAVRRSMLRKPAPPPPAAEGEEPAPVIPWDRGQALTNFYYAAKPIHSLIRQLGAECHVAEQAYGFNPLARMRLNIQAADAARSLNDLREDLERGAAAANEDGDAEAGYLIDPDEG